MPWRRRQVTEETAVPPRRRPLLWPWLVLLLLLVAGLIAAAVLLTRDDGGSQPATNAAGTTTVTGAETVRVPNVVGLSAAQAVTRLRAAGLEGQTNPVASERPKNTVLRQSPAAGARARKGSTVALAISSGRRVVTVPRVVGLSEAQATAKLRGLGFQTRVSRIASTKPEGLVTAQLPAQGATALRGSPVGLVVSDGPPTTTNSTTTTTTTTTKRPPLRGPKLPNVVGMGQLQAIKRLEAAGFRVDSYPARSNRPRGLVVSQKPPAGTRLPPKSLVRIYVSLGPGRRPLRVVPDVVGKTESQAKRVLANVGFTVKTIAQATESSSAVGSVVVDQKPKAGNRAPAGSQVLLYLGEG
jgi:eukaryotic-like serine/threonine-protein kinase